MFPKESTWSLPRIRQCATGSVTADLPLLSVRKSNLRCCDPPRAVKSQPPHLSPPDQSGGTGRGRLVPPLRRRRRSAAAWPGPAPRLRPACACCHSNPLLASAALRERSLRRRADRDRPCVNCVSAAFSAAAVRGQRQHRGSGAGSRSGCGRGARSAAAGRRGRGPCGAAARAGACAERGARRRRLQAFAAVLKQGGRPLTALCVKSNCG